MVRPVKKQEQKPSIEAAVAAHMALIAPRLTAPQCMKQLLVSVKEQTGNPTLTIPALKKGLYNWQEKGWVKIDGTVLQLTRAGRCPITTLAEEATAAPTIQ